MLYSFAYFPRQIFFISSGVVLVKCFFQLLKNVQEILYMEILYVWTVMFDIRLVGISSGKYCRQVEVCA